MDQNDLEKRIKVLEEWKRERERQQIVYPLDNQSVQVLQQYFMRLTATVLTIGGAAAHTFITYIGNQGNREFQVGENTYVPYTVNVSSNVFTLIGNSRFRFVDDEQVYFVTEDTFPSPLDGVTTYYVINSDSTGQSFQVSTSLGGAAVNITDDGTGKQYIFYL